MRYADGNIANLARDPGNAEVHAAAFSGAALASCLGAAAMFRQHVGLQSVERRVSAWNFGEGDSAARGPIDAGRVLMVGAGAVAGSLTYWLHAFGVQGSWTIVDADEVKLHNLNRGLVFSAAHAGWPDGSPRKKVRVLEPLLPSSRAIEGWYDQVRVQLEGPFDVILPLANERGVRNRLANRGDIMVLQATTGANWLSQLHRHVAGRDDCIACRFGELGSNALACSTGEIPSPGGGHTDAALPFLSAASGLMLAVMLQRLQRGELMTDPCNDWRWDFDSQVRMARSGRRQCREGCNTRPPMSLRQALA